MASRIMADLISFCEPAECAWMETSTLAPQRPAAASHSGARADPGKLAHQAPRRIGVSAGGQSNHAVLRRVVVSERSPASPLSHVPGASLNGVYSSFSETDRARLHTPFWEGAPLVTATAQRQASAAAPLPAAQDTQQERARLGQREEACVQDSDSARRPGHVSSSQSPGRPAYTVLAAADPLWMPDPCSAEWLTANRLASVKDGDLDRHRDRRDQATTGGSDSGCSEGSLSLPRLVAFALSPAPGPAFAPSFSLMSVIMSSELV